VSRPGKFPEEDAMVFTALLLEAAAGVVVAIALAAWARRSLATQTDGPTD
jgi:hypothetical protein